MKLLLVILILLISAGSIFFVWYKFIRVPDDAKPIKEPTIGDELGLTEEEKAKMEYYRKREIEAGEGQGLWYVDPLTFLCGRHKQKGIYQTKQDCVKASNRMKPVIPIGGNCDNFKTLCQIGSTCFFGKCTRVAKEGETCGRNIICDEGYTCGNDLICIPKKK